MTYLSIDDAMGWLIVGLINDHFPHPDEPDPEEDSELGTAGCIINCGPCGALHYLSSSEEGRRWVEDAVRRIGFQHGWCYWNPPADGLKWDWFESYWAGHKGCAFSNGVALGCAWADEDELSRVFGDAVGQ
jgi:hypothetical protein